MAQYPIDSGFMPIPEYFQFSREQYGDTGYDQSPLPPPPPPHHKRHYDAHSVPQNYTYRDHIEEEHRPSTPPPIPPKEPLVATAPSPTETIIEPDLLPPHSNPQALTQSQSEAFLESSHVLSLHVGKDEVWSSESGYALYVIEREEGHRGRLHSAVPVIRVTRVSDGRTMGNIRFHTLSTTRIDMSINGRETSLSHSGVLHDRWGFMSTTTRASIWYWKKDKSTGGAKLEDAKKGGTVLARIRGDLLTFESGRLSDASCEEILLSAIALAEAARRQRKDGEVGDLASAVGNFVGIDSRGSIRMI